MKPNRFQSAPYRRFSGSIATQFTPSRPRLALLLLVLSCLLGLPAAGKGASSDPRNEFSQAWRAAAQGQRDLLDQSLNRLQGYVLFPYLQYEDYRHRRAKVSAEEMAAFIASHDDWAFTPGLEKAWLRTLGRQERWDELILRANAPRDTEIRCYLATAKIQRKQTAGLLPEAQSLWAVGKSQPDACDPVFDWLRREGGITPGLAWQRIQSAMDARQPRLTRYLARYLDEPDRVWADRWYQQDRSGYRQLKQARSWPDTGKSRDITDYGLRRLARSDPDRAWNIFLALDDHFEWSPDRRAGLLHALALWSAVDRSPATGERMKAVPDAYRDDRLLEWWARFGLWQGDWGTVNTAIDMMSDDLRYDARWRYWGARARQGIGDAEQARSELEHLALEANFYGFMAADHVDMPYTICPEAPVVDEQAVQALNAEDGIQRALELRRAGIPNWARAEWNIVTRRLDLQGLRTAAALATREDWPDMAIFALGDSGDLRWYEWRFPVTYGPLVESNAGSRKLDPSWVLGLMRSESAMAEDAISSANARGLMQVTPGTARQLARRHVYTYSGQNQLLQAEDNVRFGTTYLRDLMDRFGENPVLASGAYNAGPKAVERWLENGNVTDAAVWSETLPSFETRDYIPRVLAFSTLYDWRMQQPVKRISSRMPEIDPTGGNGKIPTIQTVDVVCRTPG